MEVFNRIFILICSLLIVISEINYTTFAQDVEARYYPTNCKLTLGGYEYAGDLDRTVSNRTCQAWNVSKPHYNYYIDSRKFPEGNTAGAGNRCRNPEPDHQKGVWCYTTDETKVWEECDVKFCECVVYSDPKGVKYEGQISTTVSGRTCQSWSSTTPHDHPYQKQDKMFPDRTVGDAMNYCRNPNSAHHGPWCYTTDENKEWDYCFVPICEFSIPVTTEETVTLPQSGAPAPAVDHAPPIDHAPVVSSTTPKPIKPQDWTDPIPSPLSRIIRNSPAPAASEQGSNLGALLSALNSTLSVILIIALIVFLVILINIRNSITKVANSVTAGTGADVASPPGPSTAKPAGLGNPKNTNVVGPAAEK